MPAPKRKVTAPRTRKQRQVAGKATAKPRKPRERKTREIVQPIPDPVVELDGVDTYTQEAITAFGSILLFLIAVIVAACFL